MSLVALSLIAVASPGLAAPALNLPRLPPPDPRELPYFMVPIPMEAAEAYWAPDSRRLIAQTRDPQALKTKQGTNGALTWVFSDDGKDMWRVNDRGQDACSYLFPDGFMSGIRTFVMDVSSLNLGKENYVRVDPSWGKRMEAP